MNLITRMIAVILFAARKLFINSVAKQRTYVCVRINTVHFHSQISVTGNVAVTSL